MSINTMFSYSLEKRLSPIEKQGDFYGRIFGVRKMSEIVLEMAKTLLKDTEAIPSSEAAHAALLFTHVAWNKTLRDKNAYRRYHHLLEELEASNPKLWDEFKITDQEEIIESLVAFKKKHYPDDQRVIYICGMRDENVHVEWCYTGIWQKMLKMFKNL
jgi:hypothetical protein